MEVTTKSGGKTTTERKVVHYSVPFLAVALAFSLGQAVFLFVMLEANDRVGSINADDLKLGLRATAVLAGIGLLIDLIGLRDRPFAWVRAISDGVLRRVFLVQLAIIIGVVAVAWLDAPQALLVSFVGLKVWTDITSQVPQYNPREAPKWMVRLLGAGFADYYRKEREDEDQRKATEEEEFAGTPMPAEKRSGGGRLMVAARRGDDNSVGLGRKASAGQRKIAKYGRRG
jgi:hypothetical protein